MASGDKNQRDTDGGNTTHSWIVRGQEKHVGQFKVAPSYQPLPASVEAKEQPYQGIISFLKKVMRLQGIQVFVEGAENIPAQGGALLAINHTGYYDFVLGGIPAYLRGKRLVRFMAKKEVFDVAGIGKLMNAMKHIPVDRSRGADSIGVAVQALRDGSLVAIFPEATISRSFELKDFKTGAARISAEAGVPLIPVTVWGSQRIWTKGGKKNLGRNNFPVIVRVGAPVPAQSTPEETTARLKESMKTLLAYSRAEYDLRFGPFPGGEKWRPTSQGGGAPTLDQANAMDDTERAEKAARRAAKSAAKGKSGKKGQ
ncbi:MAG: lysophospholipid acyltransferase family protein [Corynebacterium sp.]|nr:lysophospholipid acyltransferase family protein [Corynebacterium sp.]